MNDLIITRLTLSHYERFKEVIEFVLAYRQDMFKDAPDFNPNSIPDDLTLEGFIDTYINDSKGCFMIAECQGQLVGGIGFCQLRLTTINDKPRFPNGLYFPKGFDKDQAIEIVKLYIKPEYRTRGFGKLLVDKLKEYALKNQLNHLYLHTHPAPMLPDGAERFWQRQGFATFQEDNDSWQTTHMWLVL